jgi:GNAT superfamily N-acetyltransferase
LRGEIKMKKMIDIDFGSSRYGELVELRYKILLEPLGLKFLDSFRPEEANYLHIGCIEQLDDKLVGGLILAPIDNEKIRLMQVAVDTIYQGEGVGKELIKYAEKRAKEAGYSQMVMHAMLSVVGFYEKMGYTVEGNVFDEQGITFLKVVKNLD